MGPLTNIRTLFWGSLPHVGAHPFIPLVPPFVPNSCGVRPPPLSCIFHTFMHEPFPSARINIRAPIRPYSQRPSMAGPGGRLAHSICDVIAVTCSADILTQLLVNNVWACIVSHAAPEISLPKLNNQSDLECYSDFQSAFANPHLVASRNSFPSTEREIHSSRST